MYVCDKCTCRLVRMNDVPPVVGVTVMISSMEIVTVLKPSSIKCAPVARSLGYL